MRIPPKLYLNDIEGISSLPSRDPFCELSLSKNLG
jgi:hypothetical protein